jgi:hypothetical protein
MNFEMELNMRNEETIKADFDYALLMIRGGYATIQQAARICGLPQAALQAYVDGAVPPLPPAQARRARLPSFWEQESAEPVRESVVASSPITQER